MFNHSADSYLALARSSSQTLLLDAPTNSTRCVLVSILPFIEEATVHGAAMQSPHVTQQVRVRAGRGQASKRASMELQQGPKNGLEWDGVGKDRKEGIWRSQHEGVETTQRSLGLVTKQPSLEWTTPSLRKGPFSR